MFVHKVKFSGLDSPPLAHEQAADKAHAVLGAWRLNGQVCGREWPFVRESHGHMAVVLSPERDSLEATFNSSYVTTAVARYERDGRRVTWQLLGEDPGSASACSCESPSAYALFTNYVSLESPIRCMDCFHPVALYRFKPLPSGEFHEIVFWQSDYQSCDSLQMNCTVLERAATREISNIDSSLTKTGRKHCTTLRASTGRPFFYYLFRGNGRNQRAEVERRCPGCGGEWHLPSRLHSLFDFKCNCCHLLSNVAFNA